MTDYLRGYRHLFPEDMRDEFDRIEAGITDEGINPREHFEEVKSFFRRACARVYTSEPDLLYQELFAELDADWESQLRAFGL